MVEKRIRQGILTEHKLPFMKVLNISGLKFYKTNISNKSTWVESLESLKNVGVWVGYGSLIVVENEKITVILLKWNGLYEVLSFIEKFFKNENLKRKIFLARYSVKRCLLGLSESFSNITRNFKDVAINGDYIELFRRITPDKAIVAGNELLKIPLEDRIPIDKLEIYMDHSGSLTSVRIKGKHPNADECGWYCLGELKFRPLSTETINKLIACIKCYQLNDCYWKPDYSQWERIG